MHLFEVNTVFHFTANEKSFEEEKIQKVPEFVDHFATLGTSTSVSLN